MLPGTVLHATGRVLLRLSLLLCVRWCMHHNAHCEDTSNAASGICAVVAQQNKQCPEASMSLCVCLQDKDASDSMSDAITLMGLSGLMRQAIKLIKGITLTQDDTSFSMAVFSVLSWFKVSERHSLSGYINRNRSYV
jgi:hypothetical protein